MGESPLSIRIEPSELAARLVGREFVYLITSGEQRVHVVAVACNVDDGRVTIGGGGRTSRSNIASSERVTLVWPPTVHDVEYRMYSVVADGDASVTGDDIVVAVTNAVFHRPA